jgi:hypothetical protein
MHRVTIIDACRRSTQGLRIVPLALVFRPGVPYSSATSTLKQTSHVIEWRRCGPAASSCGPVHASAAPALFTGMSRSKLKM